MERVIHSTWPVYQQWRVLDLLPPPSAGNCCSADLCDIVGTEEAKQKGLYRNIDIIWAQ